MCKARYMMAFAGLQAVLWIVTPSLAAPMVSDIHHSVRDGHTRLVVDLSADASYRIYGVSDPERIAVDLRNVRLASDVTPFAISEGVVRRVRVNRLSWGAQIVFDLREKATWRDLYLASVEGMPSRIIVDVAAEAAPASPTPAAVSTSPGKRPSASPPDQDKRSLVVALDAGHGGSDPGAIGRHKLIEKREALDIAKRVAAEINSRPGFEAVLTRTGDEFLSLPVRTKIAQRKGADIFVSIHLNSAPKRSARGTEVFFLSPAGAQSTASKLLANKSRAAKELGVVGSNSADILHMLVDVNQQSMMQRSSLLAEEVLRSMNRRGLPPTRSVKQRSFAVLKSIAMPSVMVEAGFVTNPKDAKLIKSNTGKAKIAKAIADGVVSFLKKYPPPADDTGRLVVHRVKKGETLWRISQKYNTTVASIQRANKLGRSKLIRVGQELVIREGHETY